MKNNELNYMELGQSKLVFGIDLGTTNSAIALRTNTSVPKLVQLGNKTTLPSCVMWHNGIITVGETAYENRYKSNVIYSVKRIMGTNAEVTFIDDDGKTLTMTPAQVSAEILKELCRRAEIYYSKVKDVVITVPAYFNQKQIEDTMLAGKLAGLNVLHILKEPTGAGYVYSKIDSAESGELLIYDLGGGTFDVTHLTLVAKSDDSKNVIANLTNLYGIDLSSRDDADDSSTYYSRVLGVYGDSNLGGDDIDDAIAKRVLISHEIPKEDLTKEEYEKLKLECEMFKKTGLHSMETHVGGRKLLIDSVTVKEATLEIYNRTKQIMEPLMSSTNHRNVKSIVLVGGSTKSETIRNCLQKDFPSASIVCALNPDETVAMGAAAVGFDITGEHKFKFQDVLPMAIGVLVNENAISVCMPANTTIPYVTQKVFTTMYDFQSYLEVELYQGMSTSPSECIFLGSIRVDDLPRKRCGELDVTIKFILQIDGRLKVQAVVEEETKELEIENIFSVSDNRETDEFKDTFYQMAVDTNNKLVLDLFLERDKLPADKREDIEGQILEALM